MIQNWPSHAGGHRFGFGSSCQNLPKINGFSGIFSASATISSETVSVILSVPPLTASMPTDTKKRPPADLGRWTFPVFENIRIKLPVAETMPHFSHLPWPRRAPLSPSQSSLSAFPHILPLNERRHYEAASFRPVLPIGIFHCRTFSFPPETLAHPAGCPAGTQLPVSFG